MALVSRPSGHVLAQLAGLVMLAVAVGLGVGFAWGLGLGFAWGLGVAGLGILTVGVAAERGHLAREATHAG
jgi:hypothetical protein